MGLTIPVEEQATKSSPLPDNPIDWHIALPVAVVVLLVCVGLGVAVAIKHHTAWTPGCDNVTALTTPGDLPPQPGNNLPRGFPNIGLAELSGSHTTSASIAQTLARGHNWQSLSAKIVPFTGITGTATPNTQWVAVPCHYAPVPVSDQ